MFWFTVQFAILLLAAYFAGAMLGCMIRRTFFPHTLRSDAPQRVPVAAPAAKPASTYVTPPGAPQAPAAQPTRFERALTGTTEQAAQAAQPAPVAPTPIAPTPAAPTTVVAPLPATPVPTSPVPPAPAPASTAPAVNAAVTAAVTAVAAAARAQQLPAGILPAAMGTSGLATVSAPSAQATPPAPVATPLPVAAVPVAPVAAAPVAPVAAAPASQPQDLTRIRAIDDAMQNALHGLGVRSFADIAGWKPEEVARVAGALKIPGRIEQENWIEQAQILAKGGETYYSRRKLKGELPTARPTPDEGERITVRVPAAMRPAESPVAAVPTATPVAPAATVAAPVPTASPSVEAASIAATGAVAGAAAQAASAVQAAQAVVTSAPAAAATAAAVAVAAATAKMTAQAPAASAPPIAAPVPTVPVTPEVAAPIAPPAAVAPPPASSARPIGMARDNLQRIAGINAEVERLLNVQGVTRYGQIAYWTQSDTSRFDRLLGFEGRIARENWIEQAQILAKGGETAFARDYARRTSEAARPARLAEAIQNRAAEPATAAAVPAIVVPERTNREDLSTLRSVRSEAYRGPDAGPAAGAGSGFGRPSDDLKRIRGVGVLIEKKLNALGVTRYDQVANWTQADIERFSEKLDFNGRIERENWVEQARILSAGGQTEFSQRVDRGEVETSRVKT